VAVFALVGNAIFLTQYLQSVLGYTPFVAALWSLLPSVFVGGAAVLAGALGRRIDRAYVMGGGFVTAATGFGILTQATAHSSVAVILIGATVLSIGLVTVITLVTEIAMGAIDPARAGSASAVVETSSEFGGALGIAILGSVGAAIYAHRMLDAIPAGLPAEAEAAAGETLGGASVVAAQLPAETGAVLLADARDAFTSGMHGVGMVGAVIMLGAAVLCVVALRGSTVPAPAAEVRVG
jgi:MFS transporter, DHA2 family, multidrug resistance protein